MNKIQAGQVLIAKRLGKHRTIEIQEALEDGRTKR